MSRPDRLPMAMLAALVLACAPAGAENPPMLLAEAGPEALFVEIGPLPPATLEGPVGRPSFRMQGFFPSPLPGGTEVPVRIFHLLIPTGAVPSLTVVTAEFDEIRFDPAGDRGASARRGGRPLPTVRLAGTGSLRGSPFARIELRPVSVDLSRGIARVARRLLLRLDFTFPGGAPGEYVPLDAGYSPGAGAFHGPALPEAGDTGVDGHSSGKVLRFVDHDPRGGLLGDTSWPGGIRYKVPSDRDGIVRITGERLRREAPELAALDPRLLGLSNRGVPLPLHVQGEEDGRWDPEDFLEFPIQALTGEREPGEFQSGDWTDTNVYWLGPESPAPARAALSIPRSPLTRVASGGIRVRRFEEDSFFLSSVPHPGDDHWIWGRGLSTSAGPLAFIPTLDIGLDLDDLRLPAEPAHLIVRLLGRVAGPHTVRASLNGAGLGAVRWDGFEWTQADFAIPSGALRPESVLSLELEPRASGEADHAALDEITLIYERRFVAKDGVAEFTTFSGPVLYRIEGFPTGRVLTWDVSDPARPVRLGGGRIEGSGPYALLLPDDAPCSRRVLAVDESALLHVPLLRAGPAGLREGAARGDYLLIGPRSFLATEAVRELASLRAAQGIVVRAVAIEDVWNEFSYGIESPRALREFLSWTSRNSEAPPAWVLLLGDASVDTKNRDHRPDPGVLVPTWFLDVPAGPDGFGYRASDAWFACVDGVDHLPDLHLGRLPARTAGEAEAMLRKVIAYERDPEDGPWVARVILAADRPANERERIFESSQDAAAGLWLSEPYSATRLYFAQLPFSGSDAPLFTSRLLEEFRAGAAIIHYAGHGQFSRWSSSGILNSPWTGDPRDDVAGMTCGARLPLVIEEGSSLSGGFFHPGYDSLSEAMVKKPDGGAIAGLAPGGATDPRLCEAGAEALFEAVFGIDKVRRLGPLSLRARLALSSMGTEGERAAQSLMLLGDPATVLAIPAPPGPPVVDTQASDRRIELSWEAPAQAPFGYYVYRSQESREGPWTRLHPQPTSSTSWIDRDLVNGLHYFYRVSSVDDAGFEGPASPVVWGRPTAGIRPPTIYFLDPAAAPGNLAHSVAVYGRDFVEGAQVAFGDTLADSMYVNSNVLRAIAPPHGPGPVDVAVTNPDGRRDIAVDAFVYCPPVEQEDLVHWNVTVRKSPDGPPLLVWPGLAGTSYSVIVSGSPDMRDFGVIASGVTTRSHGGETAPGLPERPALMPPGMVILSVPLRPWGDPILGSGNGNIEFSQVIIRGGCDVAGLAP